MTGKQKRVAITLIVCSVWIVAVLIGTYFRHMKEAMTPEERLEASGYCDVVYIAYEDGKRIRNSHFLGATPIMALGIVWYDDAPTMSLYGDVDQELVGWLADVVRVALECEEPWRIIEIDVLYEHNSDLKLAGTIMITRARGLPDGTKRHLDELEAEYAVRDWLEHGNIVPVSTLRFLREYVRGTNCERKN